MAQITLTETEQLLMEYLPNSEELSINEIEFLANNLDEGESVWVAIESTRCPSTDMRTYILHVSYNKPEFDYYGAEEISLKMLKEEK